MSTFSSDYIVWGLLSIFCWWNKKKTFTFLPPFFSYLQLFMISWCPKFVISINHFLYFLSQYIFYLKKTGERIEKNIWMEKTSQWFRCIEIFFERETLVFSFSFFFLLLLLVHFTLSSISLLNSPIWCSYASTFCWNNFTFFSSNTFLPE